MDDTARQPEDAQTAGDIAIHMPSVEPQIPSTSAQHETHASEAVEEECSGILDNLGEEVCTTTTSIAVGAEEGEPIAAALISDTVENVASEQHQPPDEPECKAKKRRKGSSLTYKRKGAWKDSNSTQDKDVVVEGELEVDKLPFLCCLGCWYQSPPHEKDYDNIAQFSIRDIDVSEYSSQYDGAAESMSDPDHFSEQESYSLQGKVNQERWSRYSPPLEIESDDDNFTQEVKDSLKPHSVKEYLNPSYLKPAYLKILKNNMLLLLSEKWAITTLPSCLRLTFLSDSKNANVEKNITFDENGYSIFVHQQPLPEHHSIWIQKLVNPCFIGEVSDTMKRVADMVEKADVCPGVRLYQDHWSLASGKIETVGYNTEPCFRSHGCYLLSAGLCTECERALQILKARNHRRKRRTKNLININNRFLGLEQLKEKAKSSQEINRKQYKKIRRLKFRIENLMKKNNMLVSKHMHKDLTTIMEENQDKIHPVQRLFWDQQREALSKVGKRRTMRWNPMMIRIALHIQMKAGSDTYDYLQNFIELPSRRTLYDYSHFVDAREGVQLQNVEELGKKVDKFDEDHQKFFNLQLDEMYIKSDLVMSRRTGEIIGYSHLTKVEQELRDFNAELLNQPIGKQTVAKKVLCYMVNGITNDLVLPVAVYPTGDLSAGHQYTRTWDVILHLEMRKIKVLTVTCDGASVNKKFFRMHTSLDKESDFVYMTKNIACGEDRPLYFIVDPPHVLKTVRNCIANSYAHRKTRKMWKDGSTISWKTIEDLYELCLASTYSDVKITKDHVKLTSYSCMKVIYASQILSLSVHNALKKYKTQLQDKGHHVDELAKLVFLMNRFFDCFNANDDPGKRNKVISDLKPYTSVNDERLNFLKGEFLDYFKAWEESVKGRKGHNDKGKEMMLISRQSLESLKISISSLTAVIPFLLQRGAKSVNSRKFSQDKLEQYFGLLRMCCGANNNPDVQTVLQKCLTITAQGQAAAPSKKGNTLVGTSIQIDESPLQKRPRIETK